MGFFTSLFGSKSPTNVEVENDCIWMTTDAKFAGLAKEVENRVESDAAAILLVAHFPDVLARLEGIAAGITKTPVKAILANRLVPDLATGLGLGESITIDLIVGERHPLLSVDEQPEQFAGSLPCHCRLSHHLSLDDPILEIFSGEWVKNLLGSLGMTEDESIESKLVARRIKQAQKKLAAKVTGNIGAESAAEWLEINCPGLGE